MAGWTRSEWRTLLVALALSLAAHLALLAAKRPEAKGDGRAPALVVRLVSPPVTAARPPAPATAQPAPSPERTPQPIAIPAAKAKPAARPEKKPGSVAQAASAPASMPLPPAIPSETKPVEAAQAPDEPASPVSTPELGDVARRVVGRRLQAQLWITEDGRVEKAFVKRNELEEEVAQALERALAGIRFTPARQGGRPVPSVLDTRVCFDVAGVLDTTSPECLRPGGDAAGSPANR